MIRQAQGEMPQADSWTEEVVAGLFPEEVCDLPCPGWRHWIVQEQGTELPVVRGEIVLPRRTRGGP